MKALALALTSALVAPQAFAAQDTAGMHYTSASEGFYRWELGVDLPSGSEVKTSVYFVHEMQDGVGGMDGVEDTYTSIGVQYNLGSRTRVWAEYAAKDLDTDADANDNITIGLRHDF